MRKLLKEAAWLAVIIEAAAPFACAWSLRSYAYNVTQYRAEDLGRAPGVHMLCFLLIAVCLMAAAWFSLREKVDPVRLALRWLPLLFCWTVFLRCAAGWEASFVEPLVLAVSLAAAVVLSVRKSPGGDAGVGEAGRHASSLSLWVLAAVTVAAAVWFYLVQAGFLAELSYGWRDAGLYYMRVKNTGLGTGFLRETQRHAPFYDHFTPGLLFLVPVYWVVRSYRLILAAQAVALAALGPCVYVYARGRGISRGTSSLLGAVALLHPSISQMAYSFSYGFHPITLAMPAVILSIHFWEKRRWWAFAAAAAFAASFEETLFPLYAGLAMVTFLAPGVGGVDAGSGEKGAGGKGAGGKKSARVAALALFTASVMLFFIVTKLVMPAFAGQGYFQMAKYAHLGESVFEILLSPFTAPRVFWGLLFSERSVVFMALVLGGMGFLPLLAPRRLLYPVVVTVFVMLLDNPNVKSICFWYQSLILAAWLPAMAEGARKASAWLGGGARCAAAVAGGALVSAVILSHFHGLLPGSRITMAFQGGDRSGDVAAGEELVRLASRLPRDARVLATFREAMLFADTDLTPFEEWDGSTDFDVVVLDMASSWGQTEEDTRKALRTLLESDVYDMTPLGARAILTRKRTLQTKGGTE